MLAFIIRRIIWFILVLFTIATISFFLMRFVPGGPFDRERNLPEAIEKNLRAKYHMDKPLWMQYILYMKQLCKGDLGPSFKYRNRTVNEIIAQSFPASAILGTYGLTLAVVIGITYYRHNCSGKTPFFPRFPAFRVLRSSPRYSP